MKALDLRVLRSERFFHAKTAGRTFVRLLVCLIVCLSVFLCFVSLLVCLLRSKCSVSCCPCCSAVGRWGGGRAYIHAMMSSLQTVGNCLFVKSWCYDVQCQAVTTVARLTMIDWPIVGLFDWITQLLDWMNHGRWSLFLKTLQHHVLLRGQAS